MVTLTVSRPADWSQGLATDEQCYSLWGYSVQSLGPAMPSQNQWVTSGCQSLVVCDETIYRSIFTWFLIHTSYIYNHLYTLCIGCLAESQFEWTGPMDCLELELSWATAQHVQMVWQSWIHDVSWTFTGKPYMMLGKTMVSSLFIVFRTPVVSSHPMAPPTH